MTQETVTLSDAAAKRIATILRSDSHNNAMRVSVEGGGCSGIYYKNDLVDSANEDDLVLDARFRDAIETLSRSPPVDIAFLGTSSRNVSTRQRLPAGQFHLHRPLGTIYNTWGYVVARDWVRRFFAAGPWRIDRPIDHYTGGARAKAVKPRVGVLRPSVVRSPITSK